MMLKQDECNDDGPEDVSPERKLANEALAKQGAHELHDLLETVMRSEKSYCQDPESCTIDALYEDLSDDARSVVLTMLTRFAPYIRATMNASGEILSFEKVFTRIIVHLAADKLRREGLFDTGDPEWPELIDKEGTAQ